jgi:hypothetical protein
MLVDIEASICMHVARAGCDGPTKAAGELKYIAGRSRIKALASVQLAWH